MIFFVHLFATWLNYDSAQIRNVVSLEKNVILTYRYDETVVGRPKLFYFFII